MIQTFPSRYGAASREQEENRSQRLISRQNLACPSDRQREWGQPNPLFTCRIHIVTDTRHQAEGLSNLQIRCVPIDLSPLQDPNPDMLKEPRALSLPSRRCLRALSPDRLPRRKPGSRSGCYPGDLFRRQILLGELPKWRPSPIRLGGRLLSSRVQLARERPIGFFARETVGQEALQAKSARNQLRRVPKRLCHRSAKWPNSLHPGSLQCAVKWPPCWRPIRLVLVRPFMRRKTLLKRAT